MMRASRHLLGYARIASAAAALALGGCASTPEATSERDAEAKRFIVHPTASTLYVYRNDFPADIDMHDTVLYVDGRIIGATLAGTFFRIDVRPGEHLLHGFAFDQGRLKIAAGSGELVFVSLNVANGTSRFARVSPEAGKRQIARCCVLLENWAQGQRPLLR